MDKIIEIAENIYALTVKLDKLAFSERFEDEIEEIERIINKREKLMQTLDKLEFEKTQAYLSIIKKTIELDEKITEKYQEQLGRFSEKIEATKQEKREVVFKRAVNRKYQPYATSAGGHYFDKKK